MSSARALADRLAALLSRERDAAADFLEALADFERRRAWAELGHASPFCFRHRDLRPSKGAAHYRKAAEVAAALRRGVKGGHPLRRNLAMTRFSPIPGKITVTLASGPVPSHARTIPSPRLGWVTGSPGRKGFASSPRWS